MKVNNIHYSSISADSKTETVSIIDQTRLPHEFRICTLNNLDQAVTAIRDMWVRGAPLIGATAAYGLCLALKSGQSAEHLRHAAELLKATRPTAVNLAWALDQIINGVMPLASIERKAAAWKIADNIWRQDIATNQSIGEHGLRLIAQHSARKAASQPVNILTHCNAGWLATVDWGTALAPVYKAHDAGIAVHVWVDETRPRNQGALLTAWELEAHGVPYHVITDNAGGHLMQTGQVDLCIVGTDRTSSNGDVCNKIGTYLKALAAHDNGVPFYVALPSPTIDWRIEGGDLIPIEHRPGSEITTFSGADIKSGELRTINIVTNNTPVLNPAFDVTPARLVSGLITERGVCAASRTGLRALFPEYANR